MPMTDHDELLARAAGALVRAIDNDEEGQNLGGYDHLAGELAALRAALAARPQPLFQGRALALRYITSDPWVPFDPNQRIVVYEASAKSELTCAKCGQRIHRADGSWWHSEHDTDHMARSIPDRDHRRSEAMPMTDDDELLARADAWLDVFRRGDTPLAAGSLIRDLRAALAAQPQPDDQLREAREIIDSLLGLIRNALVSDSDREAIRAAVAEPATPTDWEEEGRRAAAEGLTLDQAAERFGKLVAGSTTPTEEDV